MHIESISNEKTIVIVYDITCECSMRSLRSISKSLFNAVSKLVSLIGFISALILEHHNRIRIIIYIINNHKKYSFNYELIIKDEKRDK